MSIFSNPLASIVLIAGLTSSAVAFGASSTTVGFDGGDDGGFIGNAFFEPSGGNPGGHANHFVTAFGLSLRTGGVGEPANANFLGDYSQAGPVTFSFDVKVDGMTDFLGNPVARSIGIALIDTDIQGPDGPSGVFFELGVISEFNTADWVTLSVILDDPTMTSLPPGWLGFGDTNLTTFETQLPAGATFASVLASVDEFQITTFVPGFFFTDTFFDVRIDNVSVNVSSVPVPGALLMFGPALALLAGLRRRS